MLGDDDDDGDSDDHAGCGDDVCDDEGDGRDDEDRDNDDDNDVADDDGYVGDGDIDDNGNDDDDIDDDGGKDDDGHHGNDGDNGNGGDDDNRDNDDHDDDADDSEAIVFKELNLRLRCLGLLLALPLRPRLLRLDALAARRHSNLRSLAAIVLGTLGIVLLGALGLVALGVLDRTSIGGHGRRNGHVGFNLLALRLIRNAVLNLVTRAEAVGGLVVGGVAVWETFLYSYDTWSLSERSRTFHLHPFCGLRFPFAFLRFVTRCVFQNVCANCFVGLRG